MRDMNRNRKAARKSVAALNREFERALGAFKALTPSEDNQSKHKRWERALDRVDDVAQSLIATRAKTVEEMLIKSRVIVWRIGSGEIVELAAWRPGRFNRNGETYALISLGKDLSRIAKRMNVEAA